jgi:dTDP-4-amino-4,6-dideoxygalactose transaminase
MANGRFPTSERVAATLVRLPIHAEMNDADVERVIDAVRESLG